MTTVDVNLCREVSARVVLVGHCDRHNLRVTEVTLCICCISTARDVLSILNASVYILALVSHADSGTSILASWQLALCSNYRVHQHSVCYELIVVCCLSILKDVTQLLQVSRTEVERYIGVSLLSEKLQTLRINLQNLTTVTLNDLYIVLSKQTILSVVALNWERLLIDKLSHSIIN